MGKGIFSDMKSMVSDLKQQYKDHNALLGKQELIVQDLLGHIQRLTEPQPLRLKGSAPTSRESSWRFRTEMCGEPELTGSDADFAFEGHLRPHGALNHVVDRVVDRSSGS